MSVNENESETSGNANANEDVAGAAVAGGGGYDEWTIESLIETSRLKRFGVVVAAAIECNIAGTENTQ